MHNVNKLMLNNILFMPYILLLLLAISRFVTPYTCCRPRFCLRLVAGILDVENIILTLSLFL